MQKNLNLDYKSHYDSVLLTKDDMGRVMAADFINFLSDLLLKYSNDIDKRNIDSGEITK
ncbi:hypothetical protein [Priestia flexa]|uniref:hypothetical protein n=1 Tax=Priestia flexa TaxID=86664 RepID=UPI00158874B5|nr:hypothetical protein [Priestia flexa]